MNNSVNNPTVVIHDAKALAMEAYHGMIVRMSKAQQTIITHDALLRTFGASAIPTETVFHTYNTLSTGGLKCVRRIESAKATIAQLTPILMDLERLFAIDEADQMEAFAAFFAERMGAKL